MTSPQPVANLKSTWVERAGSFSRLNMPNTAPLASFFGPLTLWHVTCGQSPENGCYGCESANNENAPGDSGACRNYPSAATAPEAWPVSHPATLARDPHHGRQAETNHCRRNARSPGHPAPGEDHPLASSFGAPGFSYNDGHRDSYSRRVLGRKFHSFCSSRRCYRFVKFLRLIEDKVRFRMAQFEAVTVAISQLLELDFKTQLRKKMFQLSPSTVIGIFQNAACAGSAPNIFHCI
jgi:hypothetical protein